MDNRKRNPANECRGKLSYASRKDALAARDRIGHGFGFSVYLCRGCGGFHLGRQRTGRPQPRKSQIAEVSQ